MLAKSNYYDEEKFSNIYNMEEQNNMLEKQIKNKKIDINEWMHLFNEEEILDEENMWRCPNCKKESKCEKKIQIYKAPYYLIIQLKRFNTNICVTEEGENIIQENKNNSYVTYPIEDVDLSEYIYSENEETKGKYLYELYSIIIHRGEINNGHYIAVCKNKEKWVKYDDEKISFVDEPISGHTYILFYKRKD